ncbi:RNA methyltransferase [Mesoplasma syrphidae]|uniref:RNA methyltransferase n=1 Tax=Mesoplasma syrphidae TaxID=225999 RepID=A0A2K9BJK0_9MOLU|nr:RNA methyltransferase [Mesoplasma syrphidae]AUF83446.1 RNA methyltransferase [Mesoplasma syrphidae]
MEKITSVANSKIKEILKLKDTKYRNQSQRFIVEGFHLVMEALNKGTVLTILGTGHGIESLTSNIKNADQIIEISDSIAHKLSDTVKTQAVFAVCEMPKPSIDFQNNILLLDKVQDPGNIGTLIRSGASFNFKTIITAPNSVSFYNDKVLRSTQGTFFDVNLINDDLISVIKLLKTNGYTIIGTELHSSYKKLADLECQKYSKVALLIGNEAQGISQTLLDYIDLNVVIEMRAGIESLNAGVAGSIIMYQLYNKK